MLAWLHPGLLITVTTPVDERFVWFDDRFSLARMPDPPTAARVMRLQKARLLSTIAIAVVTFGWMALAMVLTTQSGDPVNPLVYFAVFAVCSGILSAVFARAQRRHIDRMPAITLPAEAVARLQAARAHTMFGMTRQHDAACKVAAELVFRHH